MAEAAVAQADSALELVWLSLPEMITPLPLVQAEPQHHQTMLPEVTEQILYLALSLQPAAVVAVLVVILLQCVQAQMAALAVAQQSILLEIQAEQGVLEIHLQ